MKDSRETCFGDGASGFVGSHLVHYLHEKGLEIWAGFHRVRKKFPFPTYLVQADLTRFNEASELVRKVAS